MSHLTTWSACMAVVAAFGFGLRANMLKPQFLTWKSAPPAVFLAVAFLSIVLACTALHLMRGGVATIWGAVLLTSLAAESWVLLWNLDRQRHFGDAEAPGTHAAE